MKTDYLNKSYLQSKTLTPSEFNRFHKMFEKL